MKERKEKREKKKGQALPVARQVDKTKIESFCLKWKRKKKKEKGE